MKAKVLLFTLVLVSLHCYGQRKDISIGYWGKKEPAIENYYLSSTNVKANNRKLGTNTTIEIQNEYYIINNSRYSNAKIDIIKIFKSLYKDFGGQTRFSVKNIIVLPNDNILVLATVNKTKVVGGYKLPDKIVSVDGANYFVEGGYVPQKEESTSNLGVILDCRNKYNLYKAFYVPQHKRIIPSVNSRIYFLSEGKRVNDLIWGYKIIHCMDFDGRMLWSFSNPKIDFTIYGIQEFKDNLYLQGSAKVNDGQIAPTYVRLDAKSANTKETKNFNPIGYFLAPSSGNDSDVEEEDYDSNASSIHIITKEGIEIRLGKDYGNDYRVTQRFNLQVLDEDKQYLSIY